MIKNNIPAVMLADFYKLEHRKQYAPGVETVYSHFVGRSDKLFPNRYGKYTFLGLQEVMMKYLVDYFNENFFNLDIKSVTDIYKYFVSHALNKSEDEIDTSHLVALHKYGKLPIKIYAVPEGTELKMNTPAFMIMNTKPEFFWVTNFLETLLLAELWLPCTTATIAKGYRKLAEIYSYTNDDKDYIPYQFHDFSMRGLGGVESAASNIKGHLLFFRGSDTVPAGWNLKRYYDAADNVISAIPGTEHSVMCSYGEANELELFKRIIVDIYPKGTCSIVSDTWDFWKVITEYLPALKDVIMAREGKIVIRPDSGNIVDIICGDITAPEGSPEYKGLIQCLDETFGSEVNTKGYKVLDSHIGAVYGDGITTEIANTVMKLLDAKGYASSNITFGVGGYIY